MNFNENEIKVIKSLVNEMKICTGGEFGYLPDADRCGMSKHQFSGYISDLVKKDVFEFLDTDSTEDYKGQFALTEEIYNQFKESK